MPPITWGDVTKHASVLSTLNVNAQNDILDVVNALSASFFGGEITPKYRLARIYYAAHLGVETMKNATSLSSSAGGVQSETIGVDSITLTYEGAGALDEESLKTTSWGVRLLALSRSSAMRIITP